MVFPKWHCGQESSMRRTGQPAVRHVAAVERAFAVLDALADRRPSWGRTRSPGGRASTRAPCRGSSRRSPHAGFVEHVAESGRYRLGLRLLQLGNAVLARLDLREVARPHLRALVEETGETATLSAPGEHDAVTVDFVQSALVRAERRAARPPERRPRDRGRQGRARVRRRRSRPAKLEPRITDRTITDRRDARRRARARARARLGRGGRRARGGPERDRRAGLASRGELAGDPRRPGPGRPLRRTTPCEAALPGLLEHAAAITVALAARRLVHTRSHRRRIDEHRRARRHPRPPSTASSASSGGEFMEWEGWYWPNHFGDPVAEHHAVRERRRRLGRVAAAQVGLPRRRRARGRRSDLHERHARARGRPDPLRALLRREREDGRRRHRLQVRRRPRLGDHRARLRPRPLPGGRGRPRRRDRRRSRRSSRTSSSRARGRASSLAGLCDADVERLALLPLLAATRSQVGGVPCWVSRTGLLGRARLRDLLPPGRRRAALGRRSPDAGAQPYGLAAVETIRIESGLIFIGYDYFQHETDPFDMSLDKVIVLDKGDFYGKAALAGDGQEPAATAGDARRRGRARCPSTAPR